MVYNIIQKRKRDKGFQSIYREKEEKKSTGLIFISADLGMLSSGVVPKKLQQIAREVLLSE